MWLWVGCAAAAISACLSITSARAETVDLALILAADVSGSIDDSEFVLQRRGYAAALTDRRVLAAVLSGPQRAIAVSFIEWSGAAEQKVVADWSVIRDSETAAVFAATILGAPRSFAGATAIGTAITFALGHLAKSGVDSARRLIDLSGDGTSNDGVPVETARDAAVAAGVTLNGLAIVNMGTSEEDSHTHPPGGIAKYYREHVTGGPGTFVLTADGYRAFAESIAAKLVGEIAGSTKSRLGSVRR